jgi:hypothetical protein
VIPPAGVIGADVRGPFIVIASSSAGAVIERPDGTSETLPPSKVPPLPTPGTAMYRAAQALSKDRAWTGATDIDPDSVSALDVFVGSLVVDEGAEEAAVVLLVQHPEGEGESALLLGIPSGALWTSAVDQLRTAPAGSPVASIGAILHSVIITGAFPARPTAEMKGHFAAMTELLPLAARAERKA